MSRNIGFAIGFGLSVLGALLLSAPILLGDCYVSGQEDVIRACLASKRHGMLLYLAVAVGAGALSIWFHRRELWFETIL